jgi:hypothetical protein
MSDLGLFSLRGKGRLYSKSSPKLLQRPCCVRAREGRPRTEPSPKVFFGDVNSTVARFVVKVFLLKRLFVLLFHTILLPTCEEIPAASTVDWRLGLALVSESCIILVGSRLVCQ